MEEELHWVVVVSLERGEEYLVERMQALKLMKKFMVTAGKNSVFLVVIYYLPCIKKS